jgi:tRNA-specific 2-thiouridylase
MIRYRTPPKTAVVVLSTEEKFELEFKQPLRGITPGQVAAVFHGDECLGGGIINGYN